MSGLINESADCNSRILGDNQTNQLVFTQKHVFTSTAATSNPTATDFASWATNETNDAWTSTSLEVVVPSADVAKCSKIYVHVDNPVIMDPNTSTRVAFRLVRVGHTTNQSDCLALNMVFGEGYASGDMRPHLSMGGWDDPLGTGDHTYHLDFLKEHSSYADLIVYHSTAGCICTMSAWGYK